MKINMLDIKKIEIKPLEGGKYRIAWFYTTPPCEDEQRYLNKARYTCEDVYDLLANFINPYTKFNFETLAKRSFLMKANLDDSDWHFVDDYCKLEKVSRQTVYDRIKNGLLDKCKLGKYTMVKPAISGINNLTNN